MNKKAFTTHTHTQRCNSNLNNLSLRGAKRRGNLGFTLIELLVVVLIIAILAAIALPKYFVLRDRAHLAGLMTIGKQVVESLDRYTLMDTSPQYPALDRLDITFKSNTGSDCNGTYCRIRVSGKDYGLYPASNYGTGSKNSAYFYTANTDYGIDAFGEFSMHHDASVNAGTYNRYNLRCHAANSSWKTPDPARCEKLGLSMGASCTGGEGALWCRWN